MRLYNAKLQESEIPVLLSHLGSYQKYSKIVQEHSSELVTLFGHLGRKNKEKWEDIASALSAIPEIYKTLLEYAQLTQRPLSEILNHFSDKTGDDWSLFLSTNESLLKQLILSSDQLDQVLHEINELCNIEFPQSGLEVKLPAILKNWLDNFDMIKDWYRWCVHKRELETHNLSVVTDYILHEQKKRFRSFRCVTQGSLSSISAKGY
ncbi:MAG: hypothetical protein LUH63_05875 [Parabacteroides sp.]|nr:hypothetical protein [Parabacteroides sp.]